MTLEDYAEAVINSFPEYDPFFDTRTFDKMLQECFDNDDTVKEAVAYFKEFLADE